MGRLSGIFSQRWGMAASGTLRSLVIGLGASAVLIALAHVSDRWAFDASAAWVAGLKKPVAMYDWYQQLRQLGSVLTWLVVAATWWLVGLGTRARHELPRPERLPVTLALAVVMAGGLAELLKPLIGRMRPEDTSGSYQFMAWPSRVAEWSDLGIPSSHAAVAFAAACVLVRWRPLAGVVLLPLACGTALTRVVNANHFVSDVVAGACIGALCASAAWVWCRAAREE